MRLDWLEDIVAVLDTGSLSEAAQLRNVSQPAFSRRMRGAEDAIGARLLDRSVKPVQLRPGIEALGPRLREVVTEIRQLRVDLRLAAVEEADVLVIAAQHSLATTHAFNIVERLDGLPSAPGVRLRTANRDDCIRMVVVGEADMALIHRVPTEQVWSRPSELEVAGVSAEHLLPVGVKKEHERLSQGTLRMVAYPGDVFLGKVFAERIATRLPDHIRLVRRAETALAPAAHSLAREGAGVVWLPETIARADVRSGALMDMSGILPSTILELCAIRANRSHGILLNQAWERLLGVADGF